MKIFFIFFVMALRKYRSPQESCHLGILPNTLCSINGDLATKTSIAGNAGGHDLQMIGQTHLMMRSRGRMLRQYEISTCSENISWFIVMLHMYIHPHLNIYLYPWLRKYLWLGKKSICS